MAYSDCLTDPRPLEPAWVTDRTPEPSGKVDWQTATTRWSRESRTYETEFQYNRGEPEELLHYIGGLTLGFSVETITVEIDASQVTDPPADSINVKHRDDNLLYWTIENPEGLDEEGSDLDELMGWLIYLMRENATFRLTMDVADPTPQYTVIGELY